MFYTFDVFDTLITRKTRTSYGIFLIVQDKLAKCVEDFVPYDLMCNFAEIRINAELMARRMYKKEIGLNEIYNAFSIINDVDTKITEYLKNLEIITEKENVVGITENISLLKRLKNEKNEICLISDMYLSAKIIRNLLVTVDSVFDDIPIFVSCEYNKTKACGELFSLVIKEFDANVAEWTHIGDCYESDIKMPKEIGGKTILFERNKNFPLFFDDVEIHKKKLAYQIIFGVIQHAVSDKKSINYNIGASVGGAVLYGYVSWVLAIACQSSLRHLFFYARDGYLLKEVADVIIKKRKLQITTHYLYGSRRTWRAGCDGDIEDYIEYSSVISIAKMETISHFLSFFDISLDELECLLECKVSPKMLSQTLSELEKLYVKSKLVNNEQFINAIQNSRRNLRERTIQYLRQEIPVGEKIAFVDMQGAGASQKYVKNLLIDFNATKLPMVTFYYMLRPNQDFSPAQNVFHTYSHENLQLSGILEILARAPHGQTIDYEWSNKGFWEPCFSSRKDYPDALSFKEYELGVKSFTKTMLDSYDVSINDYRKFSNDLLLQLETKPDAIMQDFIGDMPFETDLFGNVKKFAPKLSDCDIVAIGKTGSFEYTGCVLPFSLLRLDEPNRLIVEKNLNKKKMQGTCIRNRDNVLQINKSFIIYGAGKRGQAFYKELSARNDVSISLVVDKNPDNVVMPGVKVQPIRAICSTKYDYILISVANSDVRREILEELFSMGIKRECILY